MSPNFVADVISIVLALIFVSAVISIMKPPRRRRQLQGKTMTRKRYVCTNIRGFLRNVKFPDGYIGVFTDDNGGLMSPEAAREFLLDEIESGHRLIPNSECGNPCKHKGCPGFLYGEMGGCPGYEAPD